MPTGDKAVNPALKRYLSQNRISTNLLTYLQNLTYDVASRIFPAAGLFTYPVTITPNGAGSTFTLTPDPIEGIDNAGHVIECAGAARLVNIPFENTLADIYWVGLHYINVPDGVYSNPRTGFPEYDLNMEEVGELDSPDTVTDNLDGTITFVVDSVLQHSVDFTGHVIRMYLLNPMSSDVGVAFEDCVVVYDVGTGENRVTTVDAFGQTTISVVAGDYQAAHFGPSIYKSVADPWGDDYIKIGYITGGPAATATTTGIQLDLSGGGGHSLQAAYDGAAGSGSGRTVTADDGAVHIQNQHTVLMEHDILQACLRLRKDGDTTIPANTYDPIDLETGIDVPMRMNNYGAFVLRVNLCDTTINNYLECEEHIHVTAIGADITTQRAGCHLLLPALQANIIPGIDLVEIKNSAVGNDGVYIVSVVADTVLTLINLDGTAAVLAAEIGTAALVMSVYRPITTIGGHAGAGIRTISIEDFGKDSAWTFNPVVTHVFPTNLTSVDVVFLISDPSGGHGVRVYGDGTLSNAGDLKTASDHIWSADRDFIKWIHPWSCHENDAAAFTHWTKTGLGTVAPRCMQSDATPSALLSYEIGPFPEDVELDQVRVMLNDGGAACGCYLYSHVRTIPAGPGALTAGNAAEIPLTVAQPVNSSGVAGLDKVTMIPNPAYMTDPVDHFYEVVISPGAAVTSIFGVEYTLKTSKLTY